MKTLSIAAMVVVMAGAVGAQSVSTPKPPEIKDSLKLTILKTQRELLQINVEENALKDQYNTLVGRATADNESLTTMFKDACGSDGKWMVDPQTLTCVAAPASTKAEEKK